MISKVEGVGNCDLGLAKGPASFTEHTLPSWFDANAKHKSYHFGPIGNQLYIPLCKMARRNEFPKSGVWSSCDRVKRKWKDVTCQECLKHRPGAKNDTRVTIPSRI